MLQICNLRFGIDILHSPGERFMSRVLIVTAILFAICQPCLTAAEPAGRKPQNNEELRFWLDNMLVHHRYSADEAAAATGLSAAEVTAAAERLKINPANVPQREPNAPLLV